MSNEAIKILEELLTEAHMSGQSSAGCRNPSWSSAYAYFSGVKDSKLVVNTK